jgi:ferric-dicitrate binding protein FerR (iron transport regulator)
MDERVQKYFEGELPLRERVVLLREAETNGALKEALIRRQQLQALTGLAAGPGDEGKALEDYTTFCNKARRTARRTQLRRIFVRVLVAACLVGLTWVAGWRYFSPETEIRIEEKYNSLYVPAGQRLNFTLEDGTLVWLNAQSRLTYPVAFQGKERRVRVEGEAFFEVAKDTERPFIVSSERVDMKVLGTTFNVYSYPDEPYSRISLLEGSLLVYDPQDPSKAVRLKKFEEVVVQDGRMSVFPATANVALWKEGIYSFEDEPFGNILKKLELYYDITIEVKEPSMLQWRYTVKFRQRDGIDEIFRLLRRIHPFRLVKDSENNRITIST